MNRDRVVNRGRASSRIVGRAKGRSTGSASAHFRGRIPPFRLLTIRISRTLLAFLLAALAAYGLGAGLATQTMLADVQSFGFPLTLRDHLQASLQNLAGLAGHYLPLVALGLAPVLMLAALRAVFLRRMHALLYATFGALGIIALQVIYLEVHDQPALAAAADVPGMLMQGLAGAFGAYVFFVLTGQAHRSDPSDDGPRHGAAPGSRSSDR
ncbi:MAG: hypothetical protein V2I82_13715 [Halieaceae bacterium]|nr:hypothetical protein [Halieaceae bacterium]